jgi:protein-tyrosine phosphatase
MLHEVDLDQIPGRLFLSHMPGRYEPLANDIRAIQAQAVNYVVSLTGLDEIRRMAPEYARAIESQTLAFKRREYVVEDYGAPENWAEFLGMVDEIAYDLKTGQRVLIHCCVGIGRTGMLAASVLCRLGYDHETAIKRVIIAGSQPHTSIQHTLVRWISDQPKIIFG